MTRRSGDAAAASLLRDDPEWMMPGLGPASPRRLRVWRSNDPQQTVVAVVTERGPGTSVTNVAGDAFRRIAEHYPGVPLRVFEHYPADRVSPEHFDEITLDSHGGPKWTRWTARQLVALCGDGVLDDMPALPQEPSPQQRRQPSPLVGAGPPNGHVLHGHPNAGGGGRPVTVETATGETVGLLPHYVKHSPDGFTWGYHGSGPAELARCILIAVLGGNARCPTCDGFDPQGHDLDCDNPACEHGVVIPPWLYQQFKADLVATWPEADEWRITVHEVRAWLHIHNSPAG